MNGDGSVVLGSARGSRAGEGGPPSRTRVLVSAARRNELREKSSRKKAPIRRKAARVPLIAAQRSMHL
jgi:hypothetical protein